jgi:DNA-binding NtrC family response regulator
MSVRSKKSTAGKRKSASKRPKDTPEEQDVVQENTEAAAAAIEPIAGAKNILITDDDPALSRVLALKFSNAGFNVTVCHNGQQAIEAMKTTKFDGIILDLIMPEKTGFDVLGERPNTKNATTPTFVMTDMRTQETADQVMGMGATNFFVKMQMPLKEVIDIISQST